MSNAFPTVTVTCPCGTSFEREVKRGRPAVWCPACREIPMAKRIARTVEEGDPVVTEKRVNSFGEHDTCTAEQRSAIEDGYAALKVEFRSMKFDTPEEGSEWFANATREIYKKAGHKSWTAAPKKKEG